jgi:hypothetical protein
MYPRSQSENYAAPIAGSVDMRSEPRRAADSSVELTWRTEEGEKRLELCRAIDLSETGVAIESPEPLSLSIHVIVRAHAFEVAALAQVKHCSWQRTMYRVGLHFLARTSTSTTDRLGPDHYEILRLGNRADHETIERVYRTLTKRYHPDNEKTGDAEIFLRIAEAHRILSDPKQRERYDQERDQSRALVRFELRGREFFGGLKGEQNRRLAVLCLLYRKRAVDPEAPGLTMLDLECLSGFTREELGFGLWYLSEKCFAKIGDDTKYRITAEGVDFVETKLNDERSELRTIAAAQIPGHGEGPKPVIQL